MKELSRFIFVYTLIVIGLYIFWDISFNKSVIIYLLIIFFIWLSITIYQDANYKVFKKKQEDSINEEEEY